MRHKYLFALAAMLLFAFNAAAQNPKASPSPIQSDEVVRVVTNLVQVDVTVKDKNGRQVTDLRPEDFEVLEDGKKQKITNFSYIAIPGTAAAPPAESKNGISVPPATLRPAQVRRTIAIVVDDLGLSFESIGFVQKALREYIDKQIQPTDMVALIRTSAGIGRFQQFTNDRQVLYAALERVRWNPVGRAGLNPFSDATDHGDPNIKDTFDVIAEVEMARANNFAVGTLGTLRYVVQGLAEMPGRKSVVFFSEAFRLFSQQGLNSSLVEAMKQLTDYANRASVVLYTIDASGLQSLAITAADKTRGQSYLFDPALLGSGASPYAPRVPSSRVDRTIGLGADAERDSLESFRQLRALSEQRNQQNIHSQSVLSYLAETTGGISMRNRNDLGGALTTIMEDVKGYYLIGYQPSDTSVDPATGQRRFRNLEIKIKRSGLRVNNRKGYYGVRDDSKVAGKRTPAEQLAAALTSPFASGDIALLLTSLFGFQPDTGTFMRSLLHINTRDLSFKKQVDGTHTAVLEFVAVTFREDGSVVDQQSYSQTVQARDDEYQQLLEDGIVYYVNVPIKKDGAYQLRVAVRDSTSAHIGAATQYVTVPDLSKNRLTLSGIVLSGEVDKPVEATSSTKASGLQFGPAVRRLRQGMILRYKYEIYNAQLDATNSLQLQSQMRLYRDGVLVFTGKMLPFNLGKQSDMKRLSNSGAIRIGPDLVPGAYVLQVAVTDGLAKNKNDIATQWMDFEIVK